MGNFILTSDYKPTGDQPEAIRELTDGIERGDKSQVLLGVTEMIDLALVRLFHIIHVHDGKCHRQLQPTYPDFEPQ